MASSFAHCAIIKSVDGTNIHTECAGQPSNRSIVFIHGGSLSSICFDDIFANPEWRSKFYLVKFDMRGHGRSGMPSDADAWQSARLAEDFQVVVEHYKLDQPFVLGWSLGASMMADVFSVQSPTCVSGLIYVNPIVYAGPALPFACGPVPLSTLPRLTTLNDTSEYQAAAVEFVSGLTAPSCPLPHVLRQAFLGDHMVQTRASLVRMLSRTQDATGFKRAGTSGIPMLVILGEKDEMVSPGKVCELLKGWKKLDVVKMDTGHMPFFESPADFNMRFFDVGLSTQNSL